MDSLFSWADHRPAAQRRQYLAQQRAARQHQRVGKRWHAAGHAAEQAGRHRWWGGPKSPRMRAVVRAAGQSAGNLAVDAAFASPKAGAGGGGSFGGGGGGGPGGLEVAEAERVLAADLAEMRAMEQELGLGGGHGFSEQLGCDGAAFEEDPGELGGLSAFAAAQGLPSPSGRDLLAWGLSADTLDDGR